MTIANGHVVRQLCFVQIFDGPCQVFVGFFAQVILDCAFGSLFFKQTKGAVIKHCNQCDVAIGFKTTEQSGGVLDGAF